MSVSESARLKTSPLFRARKTSTRILAEPSVTPDLAIWSIAVARLACKFEVRGSAVHGFGVFARRPIRAGALIGLYAGRAYGPTEIDANAWEPGLTYAFALSDGSYIDAREGGNDTRFINHSCEPNCAAYETQGSPLSVEIWCERDIRDGEELFLDYSLDISDNDPLPFMCHCASVKCRGTMGAVVPTP